jgi:hypothetical protein
MNSKSYSNNKNKPKMIPVTQTKVVVTKSSGEMVVRGNCYAAAIASVLEMDITAIPNVETLFPIEGGYWSDVMQTFLKSIGWELRTNDQFRVFHDDTFIVDSDKEYYRLECEGRYYLVSGNSPRGVKHICIYKNGKLVHDPHPTREGILTHEYFEELIKL